MSVFEDVLNAYATLSADMPRNSGAVLGMRVESTLFAQTKKQAQDVTDAYNKALLGMLSRAPRDVWIAVMGDCDKGDDLSNPLVLAYHIGQLSMAAGILSNHVAQLAEDDFIPRMQAPDMTTIAKCLGDNRHIAYTNAELSAATGLHVDAVAKLTNEMIVMGALTYHWRFYPEAEQKKPDCVWNLAPVGQIFYDEYVKKT